MIALSGSLSFALLMLITRSLRATPDIVLTTSQFGGTFLLVTHDRRMLDEVLLTRRWEVAAGVVTEVPPD